MQTAYEGGDLRAYSLSAEWEFETALTWDDCSALLQDRLTPEFETRDVGPRATRFARRLPGDVYELGVDSEPSKRGPHVRVRFVASAY